MSALTQQRAPTVRPPTVKQLLVQMVVLRMELAAVRRERDELDLAYKVAARLLEGAT